MDQTTQFTASGRIIDRTAPGGAGGLVVEAWDAEQIVDGLIARAVTDANGAFTLALDERVVALFEGRLPLLFFRVFRAAVVIADSEKTLTWQVGPTAPALVMVISATRPDRPSVPGQLVVRGTVRNASGPLVGYSVQAVQQLLRKEQPLGKPAITDAQGRYSITYSPDLVPGGVAELLVRVTAPTGAPAAESAMVCRAPTITVLDVGPPDAGPSEVDTVGARLSAQLRDVAPASLTAAELALLACSTEIDANRVTSYVAAHALAPQLRVTTDVAYALVRAGLPSDPRALLFQSPTAHRQALAAAVDANLIQPPAGGSLDAWMAQLRDATIAMHLAPRTDGTASFGDLLGTSGTSAATQLAIVTAYVDNRGVGNDFWVAVGKVPDLQKPGAIAGLQFTLQAWAVTRSVPVIAQLQKMRTSDGKLKQPSDMVNLTVADWRRIADQVAVPASIPGASPDEKKANYAIALERAAEGAFPSSFVVARVAADPQFGNADLKLFFQQAPDFEFGATRVSSYMASKPGAVRGVADANKLAARLQGMERLYKVLAKSPSRWNDMQVLMTDGVHSAQSIARGGRKRFTGNYAGKLGANADDVFDQAQWVTAAAHSLAGKYSASFNSASAYVLPGPVADGPQVADWATLFGSLDYCPCAECNAIHGPAAYLVDMLQFLARYEVPSVSIQAPLMHQMLPGQLMSKSAINLFFDGGEVAVKRTAKDVLFDRRPDIFHLDLSCENTDTPLPYIDLVNEILEYAVAAVPPAPGVPLPDHIDTDGTADELAVNPAPAPPDVAAATTLAASVFPWVLPYSPPAQETRVYLDHLGVPRQQLMEAFARGTAPEPADFAVRIAVEQLGLSQKHRDILNGNAPEPTWQQFGLDAAGWLTTLAALPAFLQRTELDYASTEALLATQFVNSTNELSLKSTDASDPATCDLSKMEVAGLTAANADRILRFLRLRRALGWTIAELDKTITAFNLPIGDSLIVAVAAVDRLRNDLGLPLTELLAWFAPIDTASGGTPDTRSLYEQLFLDKAVTNPVDAAFTLPLAGNVTLTAHLPAVLAAFRASGANLALLTDGTVSQSVLDLPPVLAADQLTVANLSLLFRHVSLARALRMPVRDLLALLAITGANPFDATNAAGTVAFVDTARTVLASHFKVADVDYLLRHVAQAPSGVAPPLDAIDQVLVEIDAGLDRITAATITVADPTGEVTAKALSTLLAAADATDALAVILGNSTKSAVAQAAIVDQDLSTFLDPTDAKAKLIGAGALTTTAARTAYVLAPLDAYLRTTQSVALVKQKFGDAFKIESATVDLLLRKAISSTVNAAQPALADFAPLSDAAWAAYQLLDDAGRAAQDKARQLAQRPTAVRVQKAALVVGKLKITSDELAWIITGGDPAGAWIDFNALPIVATPSAKTLFPAWQRLNGAFALRDAIPAGPTALLELLQIAATGKNSDGQPADFLSVLADRAGWPLDDLRALAGAGGWFVTAFAPLTTDARMVRLADCAALVKRIGVSVAAALPWCVDDATAQAAVDAAHAAKNAAKAKYDEATWTTTARPLVDVLRERQRDALVGYLVWQRGYDGPDRLFEELLVDVEMSACFLTSRIKLAMGSVQTFIQRGFLHLEAEVAFDDEAADEWKWRRNFRVWEANRKVFLYPENWIDPQLRDDATELFTALESELQQNDLTQDTAEQAFENYLERLDDLTRLEVAGACVETDVGTDHVDVLHVFGRTQQGSPPTYYHRTQVDSTTWTPWEKLDLDIEGSHFIPVVWNHRLFAFWPVFKTKADPDQTHTVTKNGTGSGPTQHVEITLAWSERRYGKWSSKKTTGDLAIWFQATDATGGGGGVIVVPDPQYIYFEVDGSGIDLFITCKLNWRVWSGHSTFPDLMLNRFQFVGGDGGIYLNYNTTTVKWDKNTHTPAGEEYLIDPIDHEYSHWIATGQTFVPRFDTVLNKPEVPSYLEILYGGGGMPADPFFYWDSRNTFFVNVTEPDLTYDVGNPATDDKPGASSPAYHNFDGLGGPTPPPSAPPDPTEKYRFNMFHHPYVQQFITQIRRYGVDGLLRWSLQKPVLQLQSQKFFDGYQPVKAMFNGPYPINDVDFTQRGAYSIYNWELFFHAPLLIAERLSNNQQFEEAQRWFHFIFDPTTGSSDTVPRRFWKVRPFYENTDLRSIQQMMLDLAQQPNTGSFNAAQQIAAGNASDGGEAADDLSAQITAWEKNPFDPHLIARMRPIAYQKHVVMKYIDNLIAWGDQLFRQDTIETINEATQLYILAAEILGPRPVEVPSATTIAPKTYLEIEPLLDDFSNALIQLEGWTPERKVIAPMARMGGPGPYQRAEPPVVPSTLYFCIPQNDQLLAYWDLVADRLFKIRHCMNIEGIVQQLPLFEPPIDPGMLVRAAAAGVDLSSVLSDSFSPAPRYRFMTMAGKATELANDVKSLGNALLGAIEKRDAEGLSLLRSTHEQATLAAVRRVKQKQLDEANAAESALEAAQAVAQARYDYYSSLERISGTETSQMSNLNTSNTFHTIAQGINVGVGIMHAIPDFAVGLSGWAASPVATLNLGGTNFGNALSAAVEGLNMVAGIYTHIAQMSGINAGYERRWAEWQNQANLASLDIAQIGKQIAAAQIRIDIAQTELDNHDLQISQAQEIDSYLRSKFSNQDLYDWMVAQTAAVYFQSYQLAYDVAKRAERCFQFELSDTSTSYIQFGYWDSLKKGLLAGERLALDLKRMEVAFLDDNRRDFEINRQVSLILHDPMALITLKETGHCELYLSEALFDMDYPGHYLRRLKNVSLSIPCVVGAYTNVNCTLTLLSSRVRTAGIAKDYSNPTDAEVTSNFGAIQSIVTSTGQNDSGLFELNFHDERYLPFEGAGAVSRWRIDLPKDTNPFDTDTVSDVIMRVNYTARDGGAALASQARAAAMLPVPVTQSVPVAPTAFPAQAGLQRLFSLRHEFPSEWQRFLSPTVPGPQSLLFKLAQDRFPFRFRGRAITVNTVLVYFQNMLALPNNFTFNVRRDGGAVAYTAQAVTPHAVLGVPYAALATWPTPGLDSWRIEPGETLDSDTIEDIWLVVDYSRHLIPGPGDLDYLVQSLR